MTRVWVYSNMRNERVRLPYWLRHYTAFADRIIVYDDRSDDGTTELLQAAGVDVRPCPWTGVDNIIYPIFASQQYREARGQADWVMWVDGDEFIYHPDLAQRLAELQTAGVTLPLVEGYAMFADGPPTGSGQIYEEIRLGVFDHRYSKPVVLNPRIDVQWEPGRHAFLSATGVVRDDGGQPPLKLLHYRWLGREEFVERNARIWEAQADTDKQYGLGSEVAPGSLASHHTLAWYEQQRAAAQPCV